MPNPVQGPPPADAGTTVPSLRTLGTGALQAAAGNDARLVVAGTSISVLKHGADPTGVADSLAAFNAAVAEAAISSRYMKIVVPSGIYKLSDTWTIANPVDIEGAGQNYYSNTTLQFPMGRDGVVFAYQGGPFAGGSYRSTMRGFNVQHLTGTNVWQAASAYSAGAVVHPTGAYTGVIFKCTTAGTSAGVEPTWAGIEEGNTIADGGVIWTAVQIAGVKLLANAHISNVFVTGIGGDGFAVVASTGDGNNANSWQLNQCLSTGNVGHGYFTRGADSNAGVCISCTSYSNGGMGFYEDSFLGNTYVGCTAEANSSYGYYVASTAVNNRSTFLGCYSEGGQDNRINGKATFIGGIQQNNVYGTGTILRNEFCNSLYFQNDTNNDGTGDSAYLRAGRTGTQTVLEFGWSQDSNHPNELGYGVINGGGQPGWVGLVQNGTTTPFAFSLANSTVGAGHFWMPNDYYVGGTSLRTKVAQISSGPPSSGTYIAGDFIHEASPQLSGAYGWAVMTAGTPGELALMQPHMTRAIADANYTATVKDHLISYSSLTATRTVTLPSGASIPPGFELVIKDESGSAGIYGIQVVAAGGENIDGAITAQSISTNFGTLQLVRRNGAWWTKASIADGAITLAKMANLAQDQFIGRVTASTGVPETATITAAARTVLDDTTVSAMVDTLGGAASQGTGGLVRAISPTLTTPVLGTATATSVVVTNAGSGSGVSATGGSSDGTGVVGTGGATNGIGVEGFGTGFGPGVRGTGGPAVGTPGVRGNGGSGGGGGLMGFATGSYEGVYGLGGSSSGTGVAGVGGSTDGVGGYFQGTGTGSAVQAVQTTGGYALDIQGDTSSPVKAPIDIAPQDAQPTGAHVVGDIYVGATGTMYMCTAAGTPGTWTAFGIGNAQTANPLSQFAATTSAQLAGVISDETGTGSLVFSNSPTFITPNIGTATGSITGNAATVTTNANLTGPVTSVGNATTITNSAVTNAKLADMITATFKGNNSGSTGAPLDLTATQATAMLDTATASLKGLLPAALYSKLTTANNVDAAITATGSDQTGAYALTKPVNYVTGGNQATPNGVRLPSVATADSAFFVFNVISSASSGVQGINVFPATGETILPNSADARDYVQSNMVGIYIPLGGGQWRAINLPLKSDAVSFTASGSWYFYQTARFLSSLTCDSFTPSTSCNFDLNPANAQGLRFRDSGTDMMLFDTSNDFIYASYPFQDRRRVTAITANTTLNASDTGRSYNNTGASGAVTVTLPNAAAGLHFRFRVTAAQLLKIQSRTAGETIQFDSLNASSTQVFQSGLVGAVIEVEAQDSTTWFVTSSLRDWTLV